MIYFLTVNYYSTSLITRLIQSLPSQYKISYQIVIVNNSPEDHNLKQLDNDNIQILEAKTNLGFGKACNLGLNWIYQKDSRGIVWIINPDTYLLSNTLERVPEFFTAYPEISLLGTLIYTPNHDIWFAGGRFIPHLGAIFATDLFSSHSEREYVPCDWISGCSLLINLCHFSSCPPVRSTILPLLRRLRFLSPLCQSRTSDCCNQLPSSSSPAFLYYQPQCSCKNQTQYLQLSVNSRKVRSSYHFLLQILAFDPPCFFVAGNKVSSCLG